MSDIKKILILIQECEISKVALANYFNVSRQMIYNYLNFDSLDQWPMKKRIMLLDLFGVDNTIELEKLEITDKLRSEVNYRLGNANSGYDALSFANLEPRYRALINDLIRMCEDDETKEDVYTVMMFLEYALINDEYRFLIEYLAKVFKRTNPTEFKYNEKEQKAFEGILYSAFSLFNSKKYSSEKTDKVHNEFVNDISKRSQHDLQSTSTINVAKIIAKKELGIDVIDETNVDKVLEKVIEIQKRKL